MLFLTSRESTIILVRIRINIVHVWFANSVTLWSLLSHTSRTASIVLIANMATVLLSMPLGNKQVAVLSCISEVGNWKPASATFRHGGQGSSAHALRLEAVKSGYGMLNRLSP
jgi:hypothetical protein